MGEQAGVGLCDGTEDLRARGALSSHKEGTDGGKRRRRVDVKTEIDFGISTDRTRTATVVRLSKAHTGRTGRDRLRIAHERRSATAHRSI